MTRCLCVCTCERVCLPVCMGRVHVYVPVSVPSGPLQCVLIVHVCLLGFSENVPFCGMHAPHVDCEMLFLLWLCAAECCLHGGGGGGAVLVCDPLPGFER